MAKLYSVYVRSGHNPNVFFARIPVTGCLFCVVITRIETNGKGTVTQLLRCLANKLFRTWTDGRALLGLILHLFGISSETVLLSAFSS